MVIKRALLLLFFWGVIAPFAWATPKLYLECRPKKGRIDDAYIFTVVVEGADDAPLLSGGPDFDLTLMGPSREVQIINGVLSQRTAYNYQLVPKKEGALKTPSAELEVDGQKYEAAPLTVEVSGGTRAAEDTKTENFSDAFMQQTVSGRDFAYVGEQLVNTLEIFTAVNLIDPQLGDMAFTDFRNEPLGEQENSRQALKGRLYSVTRFRKAIFPLRSGELVIPKRELKAQVQMRSRSLGGFPLGNLDPFDPNFFEDMFGSRQIKAITLTANPITVSVKELPPRPNSIPTLGAKEVPVGDTAISLSYEPGDVRYGDTKTITVIVRSDGNLANLKSLGLASTPEYKIYEEAPQSESRIDHGKLVSIKKFKASIVPQRGGAISLKPFALGYFDPEQGAYQVTSTQALAFAVLGAPIQAPKQNAALDAPSSVSRSSPPAREPPEIQRPPSTPLPAYQEISAFREFSQSLSLEMVIFLLTALLALIFASVVVARVIGGKKPEKIWLSRIRDAATLGELRVALEEAIRMKLQHSNSVVPEGAISSAVQNRELRFAIESLLNEINERLYGGKQNEVGSVSDYRERALSIAKQV